MGLLWVLLGTLIPPAVAGQTVRVVSLSPAISQGLASLGLGDRVVGRTPWCRMLPPAVPVVGDLYRIDYERLIRVRPTHVLLQASGTAPDPELRALARSHGWTVRAWPHLDRVEDIRGLIDTIPTVLFGEQAPEAVARRRQALLAALDGVAALRPCERDPGPLALVTGGDPLLAFGRATYLDDLLQAWGLRNALQTEGWRTLTLEGLSRLRTRAVIWLTDHPEQAPRPLQEAFGERLHVLQHPGVLLPSTTLPSVAQALAATLAAVAGCRRAVAEATETPTQSAIPIP